ncbi:MAG: MoaD/ThiS family protein, partial [Alphaproteobacteria bacterium]|nr:MoaD/ThiS family protein [Alphaproteobacteria bacterium]
WGNLRRFLPDGAGTAAVQVADGATIDDLARQLDMQHDLWAAALNGSVVPFSTRLSEGDQVFLFDHLHGG